MLMLLTVPVGSVFRDSWFFLGDPSCMKPPDYPVAVGVSSGVFLDGKARMCGGSGGTSDCYEYALGDDAWTLSDYELPESRSRHVGDSRLLLLGNDLVTDCTF